MQKYTDIELDKDLTPIEANEKITSLVTSLRSPGHRLSWDSCGRPHEVQHTLNWLSAPTYRWKKRLDTRLGCGDFSIWCANVINRKYFPRVFMFTWENSNGEIKHHVMCFVRQKDGRFCHVGDWGLFGPYLNLREACSMILTIQKPRRPVGWALLSSDLKLIQCGRGLPDRKVI